MPSANYGQTSFLGGIWSLTAQGRFDLPTYRTAMNVCLNGIPVEPGAWQRRPGTMDCGTTRNGNKARIINFELQQNAPYDMEFTDSTLRFWSGPNIVTTNDDVAITAISSANPAVMQTTTAPAGWATGNQIFLKGLGVNNPTLQNRTLLITRIDTTHFSLQDALTLANIDGSTIGSFVSGTASRILEIASPYSNATFPTLRSVQAQVQAQTTAVLLQGQTAPYVLAEATQPTASNFATFTLSKANLLDGPYLDPVPGGATLTPSGTNGVITLTIQFTAWSSTQVYSKGDFAALSGVNYQSLIDQNINLQPDQHVGDGSWKTVSTGVAIGSNGFVGTDVGRAVRLFSEPAAWDSTHTYVKNDIVKYKSVYYVSNAASNLNNIPDATTVGATPSWSVRTGSDYAKWTWGRITSIATFISQVTGANIGGMTGSGSVNPAFDGILNQVYTSACYQGGGGPVLFSTYVGKNYTGSPQAVSFAAVFPCSNIDFCQANFGTNANPLLITFNLRGKQSAPANSSDGTLIGTTGQVTSGRKAVTIQSTDTVTQWNYVWLEMQSTAPGGFFNAGDSLVNALSELQFFSPAGTGSTSVSLQVLGDALVSTAAISLWRLGVYSDTTGWPTCGCYAEGRIWLAGSIGNRFDGSVSNGQSLISPEKINFAPTGKDGSVADSNAISYTFNSKEVDTILWLEPDQQGVLAGTQKGEWLIEGGGNTITPTNIKARRVTKIGCANVEPVRTEHTLAFVQAKMRKMMEYFADVFSGKFSAPNLIDKAKQLTVGGILRLAYQQELAPIIWALLANGSLIGCTYKRETLSSSQGPTFNGWHQHALGSGDLIEDIAVGSSQTGNLDALKMVVNDANTNARHVLLMQDLFEEGNGIADGRFLDHALVPTFSQNVTVLGTPCLQLGGLWPLNGKTVTAFIGGLDCNDYVVANGVINVPYVTANPAFTTTFVSTYVGTLPILVGICFTSRGQIVRAMAPAEAGTPRGVALAKQRRNNYIGALLVQTRGISFGTDFARLHAVSLRTGNTVTGGRALTSLELKTGVIRDNLDDPDSFDGMVCWEITRPFPAIIAALTAFDDGKEPT